MACARRSVGKLACKKPHFNTNESAIITACSEYFEFMQKGAPRAHMKERQGELPGTGNTGRKKHTK